MRPEHLEFITYLIGNLSEKLGWSQGKVYNALDSAGIIKGYIIPGYDVLHTFGKEYLMEDITSLMAKKGIAL